MKSLKISDYISRILRDVEKNGDRALLRYGAKYDCVKLDAAGLKVDMRQQAGVPVASSEVRSALDRAASNIKKFHARELKNICFSWDYKHNGMRVGQVVRPVESVGIYVPGGRFSYPSTVLMTAIPAKIASVKEITIVTPPKNITPELLYAARISGVSRLYRVGGPWAIAALAFGTPTIPAVDLIVGPGNAFVNEAKRQVFGKTGIDSLAGPSEVAIIADDTANERYIAQDVLAQLEHDPAARAYLYTDSLRIFRGVNKSLFGKVNRKQFKALKCPIERAVQLVNDLGPEHVEITVKNAKRTTAGIRNAGAVFIGNYSPVAVGDYWAGPSHTLPTGRAARFSGGVSVSTFLKRTSVIELTKNSFLESAKWIKAVAETEGLVEHKKSIEIREK